MRRCVGRASAVAALVLGLAGCSPERGAALPSPSASGRSPSASPSARPLTKAEIESQAVAAVRAYYAALDGALKTGAVAPAMRLITSDCSCRRLIGNIAGLWRNGGVRGNAFFELTSVRFRDGSTRVASVYTRFDGQPYDVLDKAGAVTRRIPAAPGKREEVDLVQEGGQWFVEDVRALN